MVASFVAPALMGGDDAPGVLAGRGAATMAELWRGRIVSLTRCGEDVHLSMEPRGPTG